MTSDIPENSLARGILYLWSATIAADAAYSQEELNCLVDLAAGNDTIKQYSKDSIRGVFREAVELIRTSGADAMFRRIQSLFKNVNPKTRSHVFYTCLHLVSIDRNIANREIMLLRQAYHALGISPDDAFRLAMVFLQKIIASLHEQRKS